MREIKFRAWNKEKEIMVYGNEDDSECYWDGIISSDVDMVNFRLRYTLVSEYIWMQYTGLKDVNVREIYEGDVLEVFKGYWSFKATVKFGHYEQDGSGGEYSPTECIGFYAEAIQPNQKDEYGYHLVFDYEEETSLLEFDSIEVIGNIYENPELLEAAE
ncbi:hypothetical protein ACH95_00925 [Bacillus glycinifermentans]|nr:hypothetical protein ACH95_00925 [Bacillus glycinifermentans]